ncbi:MAG TPA: hypothetical protein VFT10_06740 [Solirubrobacterales bacterium]|nr:hypothetical protein [Solirubrobacterales bacterium]
MHRKIIVLTITAVMTAVSLVGASVASAATEVGSACTGDRAEPPPNTIVQLASTSNPSLVSPIQQAGVITKWKVAVIAYPGGISEKLKVLRPAGVNTFTTVGESTTQAVVSGLNTFDTRIPVQAGDRIGASSPLAVIYCEAVSAPTDVLGVALGDTGVGSTTTFAEQPKGQLSLAAIVEPDGDGDGYGDETQDLCPQNAAFQVPCPVVTLSTSRTVRKGLVKVLVTADLQATVTVAGTVKLGKGKTAKLKGGTQVVAPGTIATFTLLFTQKLKEKLKALSSKQSLPLSISVTAPNPVGSASSKTLKANLKGQKKPRKKGKGKPKA